MAVSNEVIMDRMIAEIKRAKTALNEQKDWKVHIAHIQLLSELLLDEREMATKQTVHSLEDKPIQRVEQNHVKEPESSIFEF